MVRDGGVADRLGGLPLEVRLLWTLKKDQALPVKEGWALGGREPCAKTHKPARCESLPL